MKISRKAESFTESVIREMTRIARKYGSINLAQGFPDFDAPVEVTEAAVQALREGYNQYSITWGSQNFRNEIARFYHRWYNLDIDPETEITVCCGSTEAMISSFLATIDPGDELIVFEPFYENYGPDAILSSAKPQFVPLLLMDDGWEIDWQCLEKAFSSSTAAIIINTPNNPTGKVFTREELERIGELCQNYDALCITDEIYDHITFDGKKHVLPASIEELKDRTITINALSKTFAVTGWRVGWAIAPPEITNAIRKVHDFVTVGAAHPLQIAGVSALQLPDSYFEKLGSFYQGRRDFAETMLIESGFVPVTPHGAYYVMANISNFGWDNDVEFSRWLAQDIGVAVVPGSSFYNNSEDGTQWVRFCFCKSYQTLRAAQERLFKLRGHLRQI